MAEIITGHEFKAHAKHSSVCDKCGQSKERHQQYTKLIEWLEALQHAVKTGTITSSTAQELLDFFENSTDAVEAYQAKKAADAKKAAKHDAAAHEPVKK
jgi:hypothetical protein